MRPSQETRRAEPVAQKDARRNGEPKVSRLYDFWKTFFKRRRTELKKI
jgi:hypothetical protein